MESLSVGSMALAAMPHYLGVEPLWISSWHGERSRTAGITLSWDSLANKDMGPCSAAWH